MYSTYIAASVLSVHAFLLFENSSKPVCMDHAIVLFTYYPQCALIYDETFCESRSKSFINCDFPIVVNST
jgi:hypothetical protein